MKFRLSRLSEVRFTQDTETGLDDIKYLVILVAEAVDSAWSIVQMQTRQKSKPEVMH